MTIAPPPPEKSHPLLSQQPPSKSWGPVNPPLFENLVEGSTSPPQQKWGRVVHTYELFPDGINRNHLDLILVSHGRNFCTMENLRELLCCKWKIIMKPCEIARKVFSRKYKSHQKHKFIYYFHANFQLSYPYFRRLFSALSNLIAFKSGRSAT